MAYEKHTWVVGEAITQERMNAIENAIYKEANTNDTQDSTLSSVSAAASDAQSKATQALAAINDSSVAQGLVAGEKAWAQVSAAIEFANDNVTITKSLDNRLDDIESTNTSQSDLIDIVTTEVVNARWGKTNLREKIGSIDTNLSSQAGAIAALESARGVYDTLLLRLNAEDTSITNLETELNNAHESTAFTRTTAAGNPFSSLDARLEEGETRINNLTTELTDAHSSTALNKTGANAYSSIDARFEAIEEELVGTNAISSRIDTLASDVSALSSDKINTTAIANNLTTTDAGKVLDARQGKILNDGKINYTDIVDDVTHTDTDKPLSAKQGKVLKDAIDIIDGDLNTTDTGIKDRLAAVELTAGSAAVGSVVTSSLNALDERLDAIDGGTALTGTALHTRVSDVETNLGSGFSSSNTVSGAISAINTALSDKANSSDVTTALAGKASTTDLADVTGRVTALEGKDTIVINKPSSGSNYTNDLPNTTAVASPSANADYLIEDDDGNYFYWRYINNAWKLISSAGGGGTGTSSAEFYSALTNVPQPYSETVDYFIGSGTNYIHYRWLNNQWVEILPSGLLNYASVDTSQVTVGEGAEAITTNKSRPIVKALGSETNLLAGFNAIQSFTAETLNNNEGYKLTWVNIDGESNDITITGGGGSASAANASITRVTDANITSITGKPCTISFTYSATDSQGDTVAERGTATWYVNRARVATSEVIVGSNTFDITQYLQTGINNITLSVSIVIDEATITRTKTWEIDVKNFALEWNYDESTIQENDTINFSCTPYGVDITKTLHLKIGASEQTQTVTTSGIPTTVTVTNNFSHGVYTAEMWMTATINGQSEETAHISHDFIVVEENNNTPIIAATLPSTTIDQYNTINIPFVVYTPNSNTSTVVLAVDGTTVDTRENVGRNIQKWYYTPTTSGAQVLTITVGSVTKTLNLTVNSININNEEIGGYAFKLKANEISSNTALQNWYYDTQNPTTSKLQFSNNFDWINGGIQTELDENEQIRQYIRIKSGTTMTIPYKIFATDPRTNGANFKIIFKIDNCRDYDATALTNVAENIGIQLDAHKATFKSTTTEISTQYGEEEYTELEFEVYKALTSGGTDAPDQYMIAWVDGVMTTARKYGGNFVQTQANAQNIIIGSTDCDICVYLIKYYPIALTRNDHITNFIADAPNAVEMVRRYNRNDILDEDEDISYTKLAQKNRDCRVWLYDISRMTKAKDDEVNVYNFQQIWENGDDYYQISAKDAKIKIQGTSSFNYRYGAANTDIDFSGATELKDGNGNNLLSDELQYKGIKINDNSLPITYANTKVNFASCEQVNNMCNAEWYQRYQPFPSLSARDCMEFAMGVQFIKDRHENEPSDGIELFTEKGANFNSEKYYMYSIANMGTSKKNTHVFHSANECCIEIKENTTDAQKMKAYDSEWVLPDHDGNYEMRYPKLAKASQAMKDGWERFVTWMVASNPGAATGAALAEPVTFEPYTFRGHDREVTTVEGRHFEQVLRGVTIAQYAGTYTNDTFEYRMAKMLSECEDYMAMDSVVYHFCYIERHTMVDNVAKNTFWSANKTVGGPNEEEGYWVWDLSKNYDNDTADGNNNNGLLVFDYGNEATDTRDGTPVFNGNDAVWFVFVSNLYEACRAMFTNREAIGAWSSINYHNYLLEQQKKVPERVWNECYWYDYLRTYEQAAAGDTNVQSTWINFLDGGQKIHQRKHYETYEEIYDSSKYRGSFSHNQSITLRGEAIDYQTLNLPAQESKFIITMFNKCYLTIWIGTNYQTVKCAKGVPVTINFYEGNDEANGYMSLANSVIDIDSGSMVQAIGDLSRIYPSSGQFSTAKRLRSLQIGSDTTGYYNPNMNNNSVLTFNNKMLEYLYVQNLPQATYNLDLSNCPELKYINAAGSGFTGFVFANGGLLNEAYINNPASLVMRNLDYLTNANFHLTSPTAVTSLRLEGGKLFDNYTFINQLTNLGVLRLTNIDWTLNTVTLLNRLIELMGINESGSTIAQSYLSGNVELTGVVYEGDYNRYSNAWSPDLTIDYSHAQQFIQQHLVTYYNENGTKLYETYINHGSNVIDPYYNNLLSSAPTKSSDIQYSYSFGSTDQASNYLEYSGWRLSSDENSIYDTYGANPSVPVNGVMNLIAVFSAVPQQYTVRWLVGTGQVVQEVQNQNYGGGYNLVAPTIKDVQAAGFNTYTFRSNGNNCTYSIMTGWEKLPTNITPTVPDAPYDIYATWLTRENVDYNTVLTNDTYSIEEKLLVLKEMSAARNTLSISDIFPVQLGYDGIKQSINLLYDSTRNPTGGPMRYIGNNSKTITEYTPFGVNKSFTIAIDYRFEHKVNDSYDEAVLLSCYNDNNGTIQGFKLFYSPHSNNSNPVPQISFGSTATSGSSNILTIGTSLNNRGMIVLRHRAGESNLYVYTGSSNTGLAINYSNNTFRKSLPWSAVTTDDAKIVLGGINNETSCMNATGTLYSVKYWEEDLGEGECAQLANWCHETIDFAVQDFSNYSGSHSAINNTLTASLVLHTLNASEMGKIKEESTYSYTIIGWDPSNIRTFYNNRIYQAFPVLLQSIMSPVTIAHKKADFSTSSTQFEIRASGSSTTTDYVFAPSCIEVGANDNENRYSVEAANSAPWFSANQMKTLHYNNGSFEEDNNYNLATYTNIRFPYQYNPINTSVTVYVDYPSANSSFQTWLSTNASTTLKVGDILIPSDSSVAYVYVGSTEINKGAPLTTDNYSFLSTTIGGWINSTSWWTRSVPVSIARNNNYSKFVFVKSDGKLESGRGLEQGIVYSIAL